MKMFSPEAEVPKRAARSQGVFLPGMSDSWAKNFFLRTRKTAAGASDAPAAAG
jgi:hypothetical protein